MNGGVRGRQTLNLGEVLVFLVLISENSFSWGFWWEHPLNELCLKQQPIAKCNPFHKSLQGLDFQGFVDHRLPFKGFSFILFFKNTIHDSWIHLKLIWEAGSKWRLSRKGIFLLILKTVLFLSKEKHFNWLFFLRAISLVKNIFQIYLGWRGNTYQYYNFQNFKGLCFE